MAKAGRGISITILGTKALAELLLKLPDSIARPAVKKGTRAGQKIIARATKRLAPRRTGRLVSSIKVKAMKRRRGRVGAVVVTGKGFFQGDTFYGAFLEFGWFAGKRRGGRKSRQSSHIELGHRKVEGKHFMERAARGKARSAGVVATAVIRKELGINLQSSPFVAKAKRMRV